MKRLNFKSITTCVFFYTCMCNAWGQEVIEIEAPPLRRVEFGVQYMPTFSYLSLTTGNGGTIQASSTIRNGIGAMLALNLTRHFGLQAEVDYYQSSQNFNSGNSMNQLKINYMDIPLLLSLNTDKTKPINLNFVAGPQFGYNVGSSLQSTGGASDVNVAVKQADIGFAYGAGLECFLNHRHTCRLDMGYRGFYGVVDLNENSTENSSYNVIVNGSRKTSGGYLRLTVMF
jgi:hypothetical protein